MDTSLSRDAFAALGRTLEVRTGMGACAIFAWRPEGLRLCHASEAYRRLCRDAPIAPEPELGCPADPALLRRIPGAELGLDAETVLLRLLPGSDAGTLAGALVLASRRLRRGGPRVTAALDDAAVIAGALLEAQSARTREPGRPLAPEAASGPAFAETGPGVPPAPGFDQAPVLAPGRGASLSRRAAHQLIATLLRARSRAGPLAFVMLDIDRFRAINDALGVEAGDVVLATVAARIETALGADDRLIRLDGDRFLIVASPVERNVRELAGELLVAVGRPITVGGHRVSARASVGIVLAGSAETSSARLLMQADAAVRRAKAEGGGRVEVHEPSLHEALLERSRLELDLRHALENGELGLVYQPYLHIASGVPSGAEALLRWRHPTRGDIPPSTFVPLAEATGLIRPIGMWALRTACRAALAWPATRTLSVNISALQFHAPDFVAEIEAALAETGFPPHRLELEITETVLMRDQPNAGAQLAALIGRGVRIALDDFGTGYSALAYLSRLPHHRIKLDRSFVQDLNRTSTKSMIRAIIALARAGGIETTAEGVERPDQLAAVRALGFTHAQGFATGRPVEDARTLWHAASSA